jgi:glycosidase
MAVGGLFGLVRTVPGDIHWDACDVGEGCGLSLTVTRRNPMRSHTFTKVCLSVALGAMLAAAAWTPAEAAVDVTFTFRPGGSPKAVYLAGSFNSWNPSQDLMRDDDGDGVWQITLPLEPGNYQYKFVIDGTWKEDPASKEYTDDGFGGKNSVLDVPSGETAITVGSGAGAAAAAEPVAPAAPAAGGDVQVTFLFETGEGSDSQVYVAGTFNNWDPNADRMTDDDGDGIHTLVKHLAPGRYEYKFVRDGEWLTDESALDFADDGFGGKNSVLNVTAGTPLIVGMYSHIPEGIEGTPVGEAAPAPGGGASAQGLKMVTFRFQPVIGGVTNVFLAGTFNDWSDSKTRMTDDDGDGVYEVTLMLPAGKYQYKFVADGKWITDESADDFTDDGFGGRNSVIVVDDRFDSVTSERGDGKIMYRDIPLTLDYSMVNPLSPERIEFKTRAHRDDVESVQLLYDDGGGETAVDMKPEQEDMMYSYYRYVLDAPASKPVLFAFVFTDGGTRLFATPSGFGSDRPDENKMFRYDPDVLPPFYTPDWAKDGVFYQIFPERFCNGDTSNDEDFKEFYYKGKTELPSSGKTNGEYFHFVSNWYDVSGLTRSPYRTDGKPDYYSFYGGDIAGVMEELPYLADLGVTIIYFNPLNEAPSNHKYDPVDYNKIDPHFADVSTFKEFVNKAHEHGIRIIVDETFNHTGNYCFAFLDAREKGRESKYWNWYEFKKWPLPEGDIPDPLDYYDCWWGFGIHPTLNYDLSRPNSQENGIKDIKDAQPNMDVVQYIDSVARYWLGELGIDGFRLDVPNEVPFWMWYEFRKVVDEVKPDAFLIGEIWGDAMPWLGPRCFHSTMNYKYFRDPVLKFFGQGLGSAAQFDGELAPGRSMYPLQATQVMMNLIDSHDTERFLTTAGNKSERLMLAALFQMTYMGIPQVYYGDEVGLRGGKDPDCRRTFPWNWEESPRRQAVHDFYRKAIGIRHAHPALRTGSFTTVLTDGKVYSYLREDATERIVVVLNNEDRARTVTLPLEGFGFEDGASFTDALGGAAYSVANGTLEIALDPLSGAVLVLGK